MTTSNHKIKIVGI